MSAIVSPVARLVVPFEHYPQVYGMTVRGDCCAPDIPDGIAAAFDQKEPVTAGDYVCIWALQTVDGMRFITPFVKRLVMDIAPFARFPHVMEPGDNIEPVLLFATINPPRQFRASLRGIYGVHKCVGITRNSSINHGKRTILLGPMDVPPKMKKPRKRATRLNVMRLVGDVE